MLSDFYLCNNIWKKKYFHSIHIRRPRGSDSWLQLQIGLLQVSVWGRSFNDRDLFQLKCVCKPGEAVNCGPNVSGLVWEQASQDFHHRQISILCVGLRNYRSECDHVNILPDPRRGEVVDRAATSPESESPLSIL